MIDGNIAFSSEVDAVLDELLAGTDFIEHNLIPDFVLATAVRAFKP